MTKEITKAYILQQIEDKFKLRELAPDIFRFSEEVVPVYNIEQHLTTWESSYTDVSVTGISSFSVAAIPKTEKWKLRAYSPIFMSGSYTVAGLYVLRSTRKDNNDFSYLDLTAGQSTSYLRTLPEAVVLEPGDSVRINIDGYTTTGTLRVMYDFMRETLR